ncbi:MAG TPA: DUF1343 domain-containing protein [Candidatus Kapabacteria bacterium]|nr:DUF1343 domain-containing protein [Candidatus Kapabacteria bacterium]
MKFWIILILVLSYLNVIADINTNTILQKEATVKLGIDVLADSNFSQISGKRIAVLANYTARNSKGIETIKILKSNKNIDFKYILTPEHGYFTNVPAGLAVSNDSIYGIPIYSLYGNEKKPTQSLMNDIDAIVIDIQDIGVRSYTYISTIYKTMQQAAQFNKSVIILDRPNPIGGLIVDGNVLDIKYKSFVGIVPIPYIHGLTIGELAKMINEEGWLEANETRFSKCKLTIIRMENWQRWMSWEDTGLQWYPTSPHVPSMEAVRGIATIGIFGELGFLSIGIGTTSPFQYIGHNIFEANTLQEIANKLSFNGININITKYRPFYGFSSGKDLWGFYLNFPLNNEFKPYSTGIKIFNEIKKYYPKLFLDTSISAKQIEMFNKVTGGDELFKLIFSKKDNSEQIDKLLNRGLNNFLILRTKYLLYD